MKLQLFKIQRQNAFDYNLFSEFMVKKNGKYFFNRGLGQNEERLTGNSNQKGKSGLMQKFERKFQFQSILKSYNDALHLRQKYVLNGAKPNLNKNLIGSLTLPYMNKVKETPNLKYFQCNYRNRRLGAASNRAFPIAGKKTNRLLKGRRNKETFDVNEENTVNYNNYFYHTLDSFPQGTTSENNEKDFYNYSTGYNELYKENKCRKLPKSMSKDCIYLFGKNKIIIKNKNDKNKYIDTLSQNDDNSKTPFIDYDSDTNPYKIKSKLKKSLGFFTNTNLRNFTQIKQEYIIKIRRKLENKQHIKYHFEWLPSHKSVKIIKRKKQYDIKN